MEGLFFNIDNGYLDGLLRGFKQDFKLQLSASDYGNFLQNEPSPIATTTIAEKAREKLVSEFQYLRAHSVGVLSTFLDYITYGYMIDNVILLITGTLHERDTHELLERSNFIDLLLLRCHPLGLFDSIAALSVVTSIPELYETVLVETPLALYFKECLVASDLDELNIEIIRNTLYKAYLEDFYQFTQTLGSPTDEIMSRILQFEADRRIINITINSFNTELSKDDRSKLFPTIGILHPEGTVKLSRCDDYDQVKGIIDAFPDYRPFFEFSSDKSLEDRFFDYEAHLNKQSFIQQFHYAAFYSYIKLREQEIRNIVWIAECIGQQQKERVNDYISLF